MKILALDLGNKMGAAACNNEKIVSQSVSHKKYKGEIGHNYLHFRYWLNAFCSNLYPDVIFYEKVERHAKGGIYAAHAYGAFQGVLQAFCCEKNIKLVGVPVKTVKKHWTNNGNAGKFLMIQEAKRRGFEPADDNEADALAILDYAKTHFNK
jgi:Holliday junction resolvasome RuvABC endonuclease subunit